MTPTSLFDRAFSQRYAGPTTCSAINKTSRTLCSRSGPNACFTHRTDPIPLAQGRLAAELVTRSHLVGQGKQAATAVVIQFVQSQWDELFGDKTRIAQAWFNSLESRPKPSPQKSPSLQLNTAAMGIRRSVSSLVFGCSSPSTPIALEEKGPVSAAPSDFMDADGDDFYDTHSKSVGFALSEGLPHDFTDFRSEKEISLGSTQSTRRASLDQHVQQAFATVSSIQPDRLLHSSSMGYDGPTLTSGVAQLTSRVEELTARVEALTADLSHLQVTAALTLELHIMLAEKLHPSD